MAKYKMKITNERIDFIGFNFKPNNGYVTIFLLCGKTGITLSTTPKQTNAWLELKLTKLDDDTYFSDLNDFDYLIKTPNYEKELPFIKFDECTFMCTFANL